MAITTAYNDQAHDVDPGISGRVVLSLDRSLQSDVGRRQSIGVVEASERCDACPNCADVCSKEGCLSCRDKVRMKRNSSVCSGDPTFTMCQIRRHQSTSSAWLTAGGYVYDATTYVQMHPGGEKSIVRKCGGVCDCNQDLKFHSREGQKLWRKYRIGKVKACCEDDSNIWWMFWK